LFWAAISQTVFNDFPVKFNRCL